MKTPFKSSGTYVGIPYKWGGNDTLGSFQSGLSAGKKAGDVCASPCSGVYYGNARVVGVDCSGFVSRVWQLDSHHGTGQLPQVSNKLNSIDDLRPGDILNRARRYMMLFDHKDKKGLVFVYQAVAGDIGKVVMRSHRPSYIKKYQPYRYKNVSESPSLGRQPKRLVIYGNQSIVGGQTRVYRASDIYSNRLVRK